jgi:hypothetical protein
MQELFIPPLLRAMKAKGRGLSIKTTCVHAERRCQTPSDHYTTPPLELAVSAIGVKSG